MIRTWRADAPDKPEQPAYKAVKAWFQQCRFWAAVVEAQRQEIEHIRDITEKTTPSLSGMPGGGGAGDKVGTGATDIVEEKRKLQQMETDLCNLRIEATRRAYCLTENIECANAITDYYVKGLTQEKIAVKSGVSGPDIVRNRINRGCKLLAEIWDDFRDVQFTYKMHKKTPENLEPANTPEIG